MANLAERYRETRRRLDGCWRTELNWEIYPDPIKSVSKQITY